MNFLKRLLGKVDKKKSSFPPLPPFPDEFYDVKRGLFFPPLLYIEPQHAPSSAPIIDELTRKMAAAFRSAQCAGWFSFGCHFCRCGAMSTNTDYMIGANLQTNSLCVHYLAYHRAEVPAEEIAKVEALPDQEAEPSDRELAHPAKVNILPE